MLKSVKKKDVIEGLVTQNISELYFDSTPQLHLFDCDDKIDELWSLKRGNTSISNPYILSNLKKCRLLILNPVLSRHSPPTISLESITYKPPFAVRV